MAPPRRKVRRNAGAKAKKKAAPPGARPVHDVASSDSDSRTGSSRSSDEDCSSSESECSDEDDPRDYKKGGYHPVTPYQLYGSRHRVLSKLGAGAFSTVWLCADEKASVEHVSGASGPDLVAMKVCMSKKSVTEQAVDEVTLLERLQTGSASPHVVQMRRHFWHSGPNGRHKCMVFEVMGENLLALVKHYDYKGIPVPVVKRLSRHTLQGLQYIHSRGVIHTDVKLENVLLQRHDLCELIVDAHRAHRAFTEQKSGAATVLSKNQKKKMKKKQKNAQAKGETKEESDGEGGADTAVAAKGTAEVASGAAAGVAAGDDDADRAAAAACGTPVPPARQKDRLSSLKPEQVFAKLADFGNACRSNRPVTDDIQTRQYRSPEVIIGADWNETADVWSAACMFFELLTGDFLFDPRTGKDWNRDEDHLALMIELLGDHPPKEWTMSGKYAREFFSNAGKLKHIKSLKFWSLSSVLTEKYEFEDEEAEQISSFLLPMLVWEPKKRQSAADALKHPWVLPLPGEIDVPPEPKPEDAPTQGAVEEKDLPRPARDSTPDDQTSTTVHTDSSAGAGGESQSSVEAPAPTQSGSEPTKNEPPEAAEASTQGGLDADKEQQDTGEPQMSVGDAGTGKEAAPEALAEATGDEKPKLPTDPQAYANVVQPDGTENGAKSTVSDQAKEVSKADSPKNEHSSEMPTTTDEAVDGSAEIADKEVATHDDKENCVEEEDADPAGTGGKAKKKKKKNKNKK